MAIERSIRRKSFRKRATSNTGTFRVLIVLLILIPIGFYFIPSSIRTAFIDYQLGRANEKLNRISQARKYYGSSYEASNKTNIMARLKYAEMSNKLGKFNEVYTLTTNLIENKVGDDIFLSQVYLQQGLANEGMELFEAALISYNTGAKLDSENYFVLIGLGRMYRIEGDYKKSRGYLEDAVSLRKLRAPDAHYELGLTYLAEKNNTDALDEFEYCLRQLPSRELKNKAQQKKIDIMAGP